MMTIASSNTITVKERPVTTLEQQPTKTEGRKDPWGVLLEKVGKHQDRAVTGALRYRTCTSTFMACRGGSIETQLIAPTTAS